MEGPEQPFFQRIKKVKLSWYGHRHSSASEELLQGTVEGEEGLGRCD